MDAKLEATTQPPPVVYGTSEHRASVGRVISTRCGDAPQNPRDCSDRADRAGPMKWYAREVDSIALSEP
ncbi:MAG: hypothetical protein WA741_11300, partial [Candidatus Sulfotelmatobacter sp.]